MDRTLRVYDLNLGSDQGMFDEQIETITRTARRDQSETFLVPVDDRRERKLMIVGLESY